MPIIVILGPSLAALQILLDTCQCYAVVVGDHLELGQCILLIMT